MIVLQLDSAGTIGQDGVALAQRLVELPVPVLVWVGAVPGAGERRRDAPDGRGVAGGGGARFADRAAGPDRPAAPVAGAAPTSTRRSRGGSRLGTARASTARTRTRRCRGRSRCSTGSPSSARPSVLDLLNQVDGHDRARPPMAPGSCTRRSRPPTRTSRTGSGCRSGSSSPGCSCAVAHAVASPSMVYVLLVFGLACLAFELTQPGFGFAGFAGLFLVALGVYGVTVAVPAWPGARAAAGGDRGDGRRRAAATVRGAHVLGLVAFAGGSFLAYGGVADAIRISPVADRGRDDRELALLRVRAHGRDAVARPDHRDAEGPDRAGRRGAGPARARRTRPREGRDVARPEPRATRSRRARRCGCAASTG